MPLPENSGDASHSLCMNHNAFQEKWRKIGLKKRAGVLVPLFSVYSKQSAGCADLSDLKLLIDWAKKSGNSIVQLLPMNELGVNHCPYDSISSFALEPLYASFNLIGAAKDKSIQKQIEGLRNAFPSGRRHIDYALRRAKINVLKQVFQVQKDASEAEIDKFHQDNSYWLDDFALFKVLKNLHLGRPWYEWPQELRNRQHYALAQFKKEHAEEIEFEIWLQWVLYKQFKQAKDYAARAKVFIKGDLPILVSRDSADVWAHPEFFKLEFAAGAPPDMYCAKGQRWGMPTYNWQSIEQDGCRYISEKLRYAGNFYDILRIDHVVGLFRIWSIPFHEPMENMGLNGFFDPADERAWEEHGKKILSVILKNTDMLVCAEDLGVVPQVCPKTLEEFLIPGNDVQRWMKDWKIRHDFLGPEEYRTYAVAVLSTHDTTSWPAWWKHEAGTVDEGLFMRKCADRGIDYDYAKAQLFDPGRSQHGRLRWRDAIISEDALVDMLGKPKEMVMDFIDLYQNSFGEKEKLWQHLALEGRMQEEPSSEILRAALKITLDSRALFCIQTIIDWLFLAGVISDDPYQWRLNTPGTISDKNWSLVIPASLEGLLSHPATSEIKKMIVSSGRSV